MQKILIIDDDPTITEIMRLFVAKLGYSCDAAHSGKSALEKISANTYKVVVCDLQMPDQNGMELYERIYEVNPELAATFTLLTGSALDDVTEAKANERKIRVLKKPFYFDSIKNLLSEFES